MSLEALRRHRHLPAAAALMSVLLYTVLVTSHVVSQATASDASRADADAQPVVAGDPGCHDPLPSAGKANRFEPRPSSFPRQEMSLLRGICCFSHQHRRRTCQHRIGRDWHHALCRPRRRPPDCACQLSLLALARSPDARLTDGFNRRFRNEASIGALTAPRAVLLHTNQFPRGP